MSTTFWASRSFPPVRLEVRSERTGESARHVLPQAEESPPFALAGGGAVELRIRTAWRYAVLGFEHILPAGLEYQRRVAESVAAVKAAGSGSKEGKKLLDRLVKLVDQFRAQTQALADALEHTSASTEKHARHMRDTVVPGMARLRELGDQIELMVPHEIWPLPTYREMLFIK